MHKFFSNIFIKRHGVTKVPSYINIRCKAYYQYKYDTKVEAVINKQIQAEQQAAQDYLSMATTFLHPKASRPGAGSYFMKMYKEELEHMQKLIEYQLIRGGTVVINGLKAPSVDEKLTLHSAFTKGLLMEKCVTELLENVVKVAEAVNDYQCADFITSVYLAEQMSSVNEFSHHVTNMDRLCSDEHAIYQYDLQLLKIYPNPFTFKMPER